MTSFYLTYTDVKRLVFPFVMLTNNMFNNLFYIFKEDFGHF